MFGQALLPVSFVYTQGYIIADEKSKRPMLKRYFWKGGLLLTFTYFFIRGTDKQVLWQTVKTQTKPAWGGISSVSELFAKIK